LVIIGRSNDWDESNFYPGKSQHLMCHSPLD
jgi:hypothetical protein